MIYAARSELSALMTRAGIGRGLPPGIVDELTAAGLSLCEHVLDGAALVLAALGPNPVSPRLSDQTLVGDCLPLLASSAFDLAESGPLNVTTQADITLLEGYARTREGTWQITGAHPRYGLRKGGGGQPDRTHTPSPFPVEDTVWDGLKTLGLGALVPATPETAAGAGAGQIDND